MLQHDTWYNMKVKNIMLSERSQTQKSTYCMILFIWNAQDRQICSNKIDSWLWEVDGESGRVVLTGTEFLWEMMKMFWSQRVVMAAQLCENTTKHWIVHFNGVNYIMYELCLHFEKRNATSFLNIFSDSCSLRPFLMLIKVFRQSPFYKMFSDNCTHIIISLYF